MVNVNNLILPNFSLECLYRFISKFLGQSNEQSFGAADVAEPIRVLVLNHCADKLCALFAKPRERLVNVAHGEHGAQVAESVHRGIPVIGDYGRSEKSREFESVVTIGSDHHSDLDALVAQPGDSPSPFSFDHGSPLERETKLGEKRDDLIERLYHNTDVVHP